MKMPFFQRQSGGASGPRETFTKRVARVLSGYILEFARDSHRRPEELKKSFLYRYGIEILIAVSIFGFFGAVFGPTVLYHVNNWLSVEMTIPLDESRWTVLFEDDKACKADAVECNERIRQDLLWKSPHKLADANFDNLAKKAIGKEFWIGLELTQQEVAAAYLNNSPVLELGLFNSGYQIFVNGVLAEEGSGRDDFFPVSIQLPLNLLETGRSIFVSAKIKHNLGSRIPIWFSNNMTGLMTFGASKSYVGYWLLILNFQHLVLGCFALLGASIFLFLWLSVPKKGEYFFYALYLGIFALNQILEFGPIVRATPRVSEYIANYWLVAVEGLAGCLLGAAYARTRKVYVFWILSIAAMISVAGSLNSKDNIDLYLFKDALMKYYLPAMFVIGASFCLAQWFYLKAELPKSMNKKMREQRVHRLLIFSVFLCLFAALYFHENYLLLSSASQNLDRGFQLTLLVLMGRFLFREYSDRERQFELIQRSPFHDPFGGQSGEVKGFLVSLDLIKSSTLANFAAQKKVSQSPITLWNNLVGQILAKHNGFKVADEGDGLKVFFTGENSLDMLTGVVEAIFEIRVATQNLGSKMRTAGLIPDNGNLMFRTGIVWGGINPIWKEFIGVLSAEFEDAKGTTTFKDVQRVMDLEKQINLGTSSGSSMVIKTNLDLLNSIKSHAVRTFKMSVRDVGEIDVTIVDLDPVSSEAKAA